MGIPERSIGTSKQACQSCSTVSTIIRRDRFGEGTTKRQTEGAQAIESENDSDAPPSKREKKCERERQNQRLKKEKEGVKDIDPRSERHLHPHPQATCATQGICLQNSHTRTQLPAQTRRDMEGFQLFTP